MEKIVENAINAGIDHLKKSPVLRETAHLVDKAMDVVNKLVTREPVSLESLVESLSPGTDQLIVDIQNHDQLTYVGGRLNVFMGKLDREVTLKLMLYFCGSDGKLILKENTKFIPLEYLTSNAIQELLGGETVEFDVHAPGEDAIK